MRGLLRTDAGDGPALAVDRCLGHRRLLGGPVHLVEVAPRRAQAGVVVRVRRRDGFVCDREPLRWTTRSATQDDRVSTVLLERMGRRLDIEIGCGDQNADRAPRPADAVDRLAPAAEIRGVSPQGRAHSRQGSKSADRDGSSDA